MKEVVEFEKIIAEYYNAPYAIAVDCCTHAIELCLRYQQINTVDCPSNTYLSVPMTFVKLNLNWNFVVSAWEDFYYLGNTNIIDAAVYWKKNGYISNTMMCLSFQFKKHLNIGRGGMILLDDELAYQTLSKMRYDGRVNTKPWAEQDIDIIGYHYYMTPETALLGVSKFQEIANKTPKKWSYKDYPNLTNMSVFRNVEQK
jgi:dTDP-4-amino-4,6-dideoxygalactose transaminase